MDPDVKARDSRAELYRDYCRPQLGAFLESIQLDISYERASGDYLYYREGDEEIEVLDLLGGYGALILGHNHPDLVEVARDLLGRQVPNQAQASIRSASATLAKRLSDAVSTGGEPYVVVFGNSGSEAVEAAIKHAELEKALEIEAIRTGLDERLVRFGERLGATGADLPPDLLRGTPLAEPGAPLRTVEDLGRRLRAHLATALGGPPTFLALEGGFHGKTVGALHLTGNPVYRDRFRRIGLRTRLLARDDVEDLDRALEEARVPWFDLVLDEEGATAVVERSFLDVSALFLEPLQGEGGIRPVDPAYLRAVRDRCTRHDVPLVFDEIQCGMGRTGRFLYSQKLGIPADYVTLSKSLGGGLAKISALLVSRSRYRDEFSMLHTSTFAEDELSSAIALATLDILERDRGALVRRCEETGARHLARLREIAERYPDVIADVRGDGLMIGLELRDQFDSPSNVLRFLSHQGDLGYCVAGHLLYEHRIRVAPTLSEPFTLRVEPSIRITDEELERFAAAIEQVAEIIRHADAHTLCRFIVGRHDPGRIEVVDHRRERVDEDAVPHARKVAFLGHLIEPEHLGNYDRSMARLSTDEQNELLDRVAGRTRPCVLSRVNIRSKLSTVHFHFIGLALSSRQVVGFMRNNDLGRMRGMIDEAVELATGLGCSVLGLGQYTSIVTRNGTDLAVRDLALTSGNSLTVAMGVEGLLKACRERGVETESAPIAIVGAGGNISRAYAGIIADRVDRLVLVGSPRAGAEGRCFETAYAIYDDILDEIRHVGDNASHLAGVAAKVADTRSAARASDGRELFHLLREELGEDRFIRISMSLDEIRDLPLVVTATNAALPFIGPDHLAPDAIVLDIGVPMNTRPEVTADRPDVLVLQGGIVRLPHEEDVGVEAIPLPKGRIYACMAETTLMGLADIGFHYSYGDIRKQQVRRISEIARIHGFELDDYRTQSSF